MRCFDAREVDYARCRVAAYEARASDLTDYIVACMRVAGYRLEGNSPPARPPFMCGAGGEMTKR